MYYWMDTNYNNIEELSYDDDGQSMLNLMPNTKYLAVHYVKP